MPAAFVVTPDTAPAPLNVVGEKITVLASGAQTGSYEIFRQAGPEGSGPPPHSHPWDESFYVVKGDIAEEMKKLKQQEGKDLVLFGGASLAQAFVERDLIDEYRLVVHPILLGQGKSLFQENTNKLALKLIQAKAFQAGAVLLCYQKA